MLIFNDLKKRFFIFIRTFLRFFNINIQSEDLIKVDDEYSNLKKGNKSLLTSFFENINKVENNLKINSNDIEFCKTEIAAASYEIEIIFRKSYNTLEIKLNLEEGYYLDPKNRLSVFQIFGKLIYFYLIFVFFYIFLGLKANCHQCYLRGCWTESENVNTTLVDTIVPSFLITNNKIDAINLLIEKTNEKINFYQSIALNSLIISITAFDATQANTLSLNKDGYKPSDFLLETYLTKFNVFEE